MQGDERSDRLCAVYRAQSRDAWPSLGWEGARKQFLVSWVPPGFPEAGPGWRKTLHEFPVPVRSPLSCWTHSPVPQPLPFVCSQPLLLLLPAGLWLWLPSVHDSSSNKSLLPRNKRMGWAKPRMIKLHLKHFCVDQVLVSAFPPPFQAMSSWNLVWLSQSGHLSLLPHTRSALEHEGLILREALPVHPQVCLGSCVMSYKLQPCASCPGMYASSPSFQPPIWPPGHPTLLCKLWCFGGPAPSSGVLGSWQLWTPMPWEGWALNRATESVTPKMGELVARTKLPVWWRAAGVLWVWSASLFPSSCKNTHRAFETRACWYESDETWAVWKVASFPMQA